MSSTPEIAAALSGATLRQLSYWRKRGRVVTMSYTPEIAAALSGATLRQLSYWRSSRTSRSRTARPLLAPEVHLPRSRVSYSFRDVLALRTFVYLRANEVSLQRVRKAVRSLREMGETDHLSSYTLVASGRDVVWRLSDDDAVDLTRHPGHQVIAKMIDIVRPFGAMVALFAPKPGIQVDPEVRGGYPVMEGTRVPFDLVASLLDDGVSPEDVTAIYPSVDASAVQGAAEFAKYVREHRGLSSAA
jgi:uncharacterized protein (DUF433 family)/DNA-binding transcriptional MerR regulator